MEQSSTEKRLEDLNRKVDQGFERVERGFERVDSDIRELRTEMRAGFDAVNERFEAMNSSLNERFERTHRLLIQFCGGLLGAFIVASAGLIATQI